MRPTPPRVLAVGGSDSSGGAGIQADLKTAHALGAHGLSVVCAVTAQDSHGVRASWPVPPDAVRAQLAAVLDDIGVDAVKTGMLPTGPVAAAVADALAGVTVPLVVDPVVAASHGQELASAQAVAVIVERLLPLATVVTPNLAEAALLSGLELTSAGPAAAGPAGGASAGGASAGGGSARGGPAGEDAMAAAAARIHALGPRWVLVKGGHLAAEPVDILYGGDQVLRFPGERLASPHTHGTGCTMATAIAVALAAGADVPAAVSQAKRYVTEAIRMGYPLGTGVGPVGHPAR